MYKFADCLHNFENKSIIGSHVRKRVCLTFLPRETAEDRLSLQGGTSLRLKMVFQDSSHVANLLEFGGDYDLIDYYVGGRIREKAYAKTMYWPTRSHMAIAT